MRIALGALWLFDAAMQARPQFFTAGWVRDDLAQSVMGEPSAVNHSILWVLGPVAGHAGLFNALFVAIQAAIGVALVAGRWERAAIVASIPWALGVWWIGEGFGSLPTGFAEFASGAPGPVLLYPLIGLVAWPGTGDERAAGAGPGLPVWAVLWAGQALLLAPFAFPVGRVLRADVEEISHGLPSWQLAVAAWTEGLIRSAPLVVAALMAAAQIAVGLGALAPRGRRAALVAGMALSAFYWVCFQYLGGIAGGAATDPGAAPLVVLLALSLWPVPDARAGDVVSRSATLQVAQLPVADQVHAGAGAQHPQ